MFIHVNAINKNIQKQMTPTQWMKNKTPTKKKKKTPKKHEEKKPQKNLKNYEAMIMWIARSNSHSIFSRAILI